MSLSEAQLSELRTRLQQAIDDADEEAGIVLAKDGLAEGLSPLEFFQGIIEPVLKEIGDAFAKLEVFLPELMRAGVVVKAMQTEVLEPAIRTTGGESGSAGTIVIGTAQGDIHDIGKNMVALMLQVNGFKVIDLGTNVTPQNFLESARRERADIIALSSLLTPSLPYIKDVVWRLESQGQRDRFMVIAGGAPITKTWAEQAGLDGFGEDAVEAVALCRTLMQQRAEANS